MVQEKKEQRISAIGVSGSRIQKDWQQSQHFQGMVQANEQARAWTID